MTARLGNVIYWLLCGTAGLFGVWFLLAAYAGLMGDVSNWVVFLDPFHSWKDGFEPTASQLAMISIGSWLFGRAVRYILSGK